MMGLPLERSPLCVRSTLIRTASRRSLAALVGVLALILAACSSAASTTPLPSAEPPSDCARVEGGVLELSAENLEFGAPCIVAVAGEAFTIHFTNNDTQPHDVNVYPDSSKGETLMDGDVITEQGESLDYAVDALEQGSYYFDCSIHPDMNGTLYVVAAT
jgi:plastocyanin